MENLSPKTRTPGSGPELRPSFESMLRNIISSRLELLSADGKEKVLEFINDLIDSEQKKIEFQRRQGRLYHIPGLEDGEQQV